MATPMRRAFELTGADGGPLRGDVRTAGSGAGRPAVVVCHGFKGFKDWGFFPHLADRLARAGMTAVSFNFSASGVGPDGESFSEPDRFTRWTYTGDLEDLETVVNGLRSETLLDGVQAPGALGLFGHSRGGAIVALRAAERGDAGALVTWSAIADTMRWGPATVRTWRKEGRLEVVNQRTGETLVLGTDLLEDLDRAGDRLHVLGAAARVAAPWLIVHGGADVTVPVEDGRRLAEVAQAGRLLEIPNGSHTFGARQPWAGSTAELDAAMDATVDWFSRHLF